MGACLNLLNKVSAEHSLLHALPRLSAALVHADPQAQGDTDYHAALASHR